MKHIKENCDALVRLALDISEPREAIQAIRRIFILGGPPRRRVVEAQWSPTPEQVESWRKLDEAKSEMFADPRIQLLNAISFRHQNAIETSKLELEAAHPEWSPTTIGLACRCGYCHVEREPGRVDMSAPVSEAEDSRAIETTATEVAAPKGPSEWDVCVCDHPRRNHRAGGRADCAVCEMNTDHRCLLFAEREATEQAKREARALVPGKPRGPRW